MLLLKKDYGKPLLKGAMKILFSCLTFITFACSAAGNITFQVTYNNDVETARYSLFDKAAKKNIGLMTGARGTALGVFKSAAFATVDRGTLPPDILEMVTFSEVLNGDLKKTMILGDLYISFSYRGKGYAKRFIQHVCEKLHSQGMDTIVLLPHPFTYENNTRKSLKGVAGYEDDQKRLIKLFQACGFELAQHKDLVYMYKNKN